MSVVYDSQLSGGSRVYDSQVTGSGTTITGSVGAAGAAGLPATISDGVSGAVYDSQLLSGSRVYDSQQFVSGSGGSGVTITGAVGAAIALGLAASVTSSSAVTIAGAVGAAVAAGLPGEVAGGGGTTAVLILDAATRAAILLASIGTNGTREAGIVTAVAATFGAGRVTLREYSAAGKLLRTQINEAVTTDTASRPKTVSLGALVTTVTHAAGTATRVVVSSSLGTRVAEVSPAVGSSSGLTFRALTTFDTPTGSLSTEVAGEGDIPVDAAVGSVAPARQDSDPVRGLTVVVSVQMAIDDAGTLQTLYFCTGAGWVTSATDTPASDYIDGRVAAVGNYSRSMFAGRALFGAQQTSFGTLSFVNNDGELDAWRDYGFDGRAVSVYVGEEGAAFPSEFTKSFTTAALRAVIGLDRVDLVLRDPMQALNQPVVRNRFAGTTGLEGPSTLENQPKPRALGTTWFTPAILVDSVKQIYFVCEESTNGAFEKCYDGGVEITKGATYATTVDLLATAPSAGECRFYRAGPTYVRLETEPTFGVSVDRDSLYVASYISILAAEAGLTLHPTYQAGAMGVYVADAKTTMLEVCTRESMQRPLWFGIDRDGLFVVRTVADPAPGPAVATINLHDLISISRTAPDGVDVPIHRVTMRGDRNHSAGAPAAGAAVGVFRVPYQSATMNENASVLTKHPSAGELSIEVGCGTGSYGAAHLALHGVERDVFVCTLDLAPEWLELDLGDIVELQHSRFGLSAGKNLLVIGIVVDFAARKLALSLWG